ncbi:transposase IS4 [Thioploca ingrica]|uniref:Transposase IS4 n=1 Tax=Thioploca ingrica TaxID=40754 RepID=A0A090AKV6_9GAMM|nr:transposase IS4 [Thioploca ingrica]
MPTLEKLEKQLAKLEQDIREYLAELEENNRTERDIPTEDEALAEKLERLKARQEQTQARLEQRGEGETPVSETDPDARLLSKRGQTVAGYNVQIAVDSKHKLIGCSEVVNDGNDTQQLAPMAIKAKETLEVEPLTVDADTGYDDREQIKAGVDAGITPEVPLADKEAQPRKAGRLVCSELTFDADSYRCPAGNPLNRQGGKYSGNPLQKPAYVPKVNYAKNACRNKPATNSFIAGSTNILLMNTNNA